MRKNRTLLVQALLGAAGKPRGPAIESAAEPHFALAGGHGNGNLNPVQCLVRTESLRPEHLLAVIRNTSIPASMR